MVLPIHERHSPDDAQAPAQDRQEHTRVRPLEALAGLHARLLRLGARAHREREAHGRPQGVHR